jgi:hypothetical protein
MVIALLWAGRGRHSDDDQAIAESAQLFRDEGGRLSARENSRTRIRNVNGDSSADRQGSNRGGSCRLGGGRMWWAHLASTRINIALTIGRKEFEELMNVKGIGEKSFLKLKPLITVGDSKQATHQ